MRLAEKDNRESEIKVDPWWINRIQLSGEVSRELNKDRGLLS